MQESRWFRRMGRAGPILGVLLLASLLPTPAAAAGKTFKFRVPMQTSGDGLTGHVEFMARGACMGRWIQIGVSQAMIEGVRVGGRVYTEVPGYDLPMDAAGKGGQYRLSGAFIAQEGSRRVRWSIRSYRVADELKGFLETLNLSTPRSEAMSCPEWEEYVDDHIAPVSSHEFVVDEILADWARDMVGAVKKTLANLEELEGLRRQLATDSGEDVIAGVLRRLEALERKELTAEARQYARELITEARGRLEKLGAARQKEARAAAGPSTGGGRGAAAGGRAAAAASALAGGGSSGQGAGGSGEAAAQKQRQTTQGQRAAQSSIDLARRYEAAGNYNHAIGHYRQAQMEYYQGWVEQKIRSLQQKQQNQALRQRQQQSEAARALGRGIAAAAGGRKSSSGSGGPYYSPKKDRNIDVFVGIETGVFAGSAGYRSEGGQEQLEAPGQLSFTPKFAIEGSHWLTSGLSIGAEVGGRLVMLGTEPDEEELGRVGLSFNYQYAVKTDWNGMFEIGYGAQHFSEKVQFGPGPDNPEEERTFELDAREGLVFASIGDFRKRGGGWRLRYASTTGLGILGGADGEFSEQDFQFRWWTKNVGSIQVGVRWLAFDVWNHAYEDTMGYLGFGMSFR